VGLKGPLLPQSPHHACGVPSSSPAGPASRSLQRRRPLCPPEGAPPQTIRSPPRLTRPFPAALGPPKPSLTAPSSTSISAQARAVSAPRARVLAAVVTTGKHEEEAWDRWLAECGGYSRPIPAGRGECGQGQDRCHEGAACDVPVTARGICSQA